MTPHASWLSTIVFAVSGLAVMLAYSPVADWLAARLAARPPSLKVFRGLQQSRMKLVIGIVLAWMLGGLLEEFLLRGIVVQSVESLLGPWISGVPAIAIAVLSAAVGAGILHLYQGLRASIIVTQLSILFGVLFVISGHNLWTVILCHGLYDTIAFIRFANKKSKYSNQT